MLFVMAIEITILTVRISIHENSNRLLYGNHNRGSGEKGQQTQRHNMTYPFGVWLHNRERDRVQPTPRQQIENFA